MDDFYMKNLYPKLIFYYFKPHFQKQTRDVKEKSKKKKKKKLTCKGALLPLFHSTLASFWLEPLLS